MVCSQMKASTRSLICKRNYHQWVTTLKSNWSTYRIAVVFLQYFGIFESIGAEVQADGCALVNWNRRIISARINVLVSHPLTLAVLEEVNFTSGVNFQILQSVGNLVLVFIIQVTLEFDQRTILERIRYVPRSVSLGQNDEEAESVACFVATAVVLSVRLMEFRSFAWSPRIAELVISEWRLKIRIFLTPSNASCGSVWHVLNRRLPVPRTSRHDWNRRRN